MSNQVKLNLQQYIRVTAKSQVFVKDSTGMRGKTTAVFWKENETKKQEVYQHFKTAYISVAVGKTHTHTHAYAKPGLQVNRRSKPNKQALLSTERSGQLKRWQKQWSTDISRAPSLLSWWLSGVSWTWTTSTMRHKRERQRKRGKNNPLHIGHNMFIDFKAKHSRLKMLLWVLSEFLKGLLKCHPKKEKNGRWRTCSSRVDKRES